MKIDLGGIAKGYAVDRAVMIMRENGMNDFFVNAGGDIFVSGRKPMIRNGASALRTREMKKN
ncbi:MAG: FAD:protein FMN transferase [Ignavibacteria bacterium]